MVSARPSTLRSTLAAGLGLALAGLLGGCDLILAIGHGDKYIDPHVDCSGFDCVCTGGFESCDGDDDNGCESELAIDPQNCGGCGNVCTNGVCSDGACACAAGFVDCDGNPSTGCESELAADPKNCGACGHDCAGGACSGGLCQPATIMGLEDAVSLAVDAGHLYVARCGTPSVAKVRLDLDDPYVEKAAELDGCASLVAIDATRIYFASDQSSDKRILSAPIDAPSAPFELATGTSAAQFLGVTSAHALYWNVDATSGSKRLYRVPVAGGTPEFADAAVTALAVDADAAYWSDEVGLHAWATMDAAPIDVDPTIVDAPALAVESGTLFFANGEGIWSMPTSGGTPSSLVASPSVKAIAATPTHVYWADGSDGSVRRIARDHTSEAVLVKGESLGATVPFALGERAVYWIAGSKVRKVAR
jgi:hypothetical protein